MNSNLDSAQSFRILSLFDSYVFYRLVLGFALVAGLIYLGLFLRDIENSRIAQIKNLIDASDKANLKASQNLNELFNRRFNLISLMIFVMSSILLASGIYSNFIENKKVSQKFLAIEKLIESGNVLYDRVGGISYRTLTLHFLIWVIEEMIFTRIVKIVISFICFICWIWSKFYNCNFFRGFRRSEMIRGAEMHQARVQKFIR